jgi:hypothetical protein
MPLSRTLRLRLPLHVLWRAPTDGTVGLRHPVARIPVGVRGNLVFLGGVCVRLLATRQDTTMSFPTTTSSRASTNSSPTSTWETYNTDDVAAVAKGADVAAAVNDGPYVLLSFLFQILRVSSSAI